MFVSACCVVLTKIALQHFQMKMTNIQNTILISGADNLPRENDINEALLEQQRKLKLKKRYNFEGNKLGAQQKYS